MLTEIDRTATERQYSQEKKCYQIEQLQKEYRQYTEVLKSETAKYKERVDAIKGEIDVLRNDESQINAQIKE